MPATDLTLLQIAFVPAAEHRGHVLREVQFEDTSHAARQELPVMADQYHSPAKVADEALEPVQPVEIEIVGGLVEQDQVEP